MATGTKIDGKQIATELTDNIRPVSDEINDKHGRRPGLAVVLVGNRPDSATYVSMKKKMANKVGFNSVERVLPDDVSQSELLQCVQALNEDDSIDGILVQLPLPEHLEQKEILLSISPDKDVDGFHPYNMGALVRAGEELRQARQPFDVKNTGNAPCTPLGCIELIDKAGYELNGANVVILGRSNIVGLPVAMMALHRNATVTCCHSRTKNLPDVVRSADILIAAIGQPEFVKGDWIKPGACVIDVGVNFKDAPERKSGRRMCGDVDYKAAMEVAGAITPVPGGVGPMTIGMLMQNTLTNARTRLGYKG
jgi:methylenetetrahydrofolate dehydrogenase (NADP+)/methenyltetrahydrofolate cyclohydrolase